jgi:hypothetical protein
MSDRSGIMETRRAWPTLDPAIFVASLAVYFAGTPLGLDRVAAAFRVAAALDATSQEPGPWLAPLVLRVGAYFPLGALAARANLATALLAALATTLLGRLCVDLLVAFRPPAHARQGRRDFLQEPFLAAGAALAGGLSFAVFETATSAGTASATLALLAGAWLAALPLLRAAGSAKHGFALAGLSGLAAGVDSVAGPLLWPLTLGLWLWELRRGRRWPLWAPLLFVAALGGSVLANLAASENPVSVRHMLGNLWPAGTHDLVALVGIAAELCDELGVVGLLLATVGTLSLLRRAPLVAFWFGFTLITALLLGHSPAQSGLHFEITRAGLPAALMAAAVPMSAGAAAVASRLGRARMVAAIVLAGLAVVSPVLDGGTSRWRRDAHAPERLLEHALLRAPLRASVDPGTAEMDGLLRYGAALGLRPDLEIAARPKVRPATP